MKVCIDSIINNISKSVGFYQPLFEAIANSLEANAKSIEITFEKDGVLLSSEINGDIIGFTISDNGEGFTKKNREAFCELWTQNKIHLGCKGSGRFTWLSIFENISIVSSIKEEHSIVSIPFTKKFEEEMIDIKSSDVKINSTVISFSDLSAKALSSSFDRTADLNKIRRLVLDYLFLKMFLIKKQGNTFCVKLKLDAEVAEIDNNSIPDLDTLCFVIKSRKFEKTQQFELLYYFVADKNDNQQIFICSNYRSTEQIKKQDVGFVGSLPEKTSSVFLLTSSYFNDKDNDARNSFGGFINSDEESLEYPIAFSDILSELKKQIKIVINKRFPEIEEQNKTIECEAIQEKPYLSDFIKCNTEIVKSKKNLITQAEKEFAKKKRDTETLFKGLLEDKSVDTQEIIQAFSEISVMAALELGEYICYRDSIIIGLQKALKEGVELEKFYHNLFMPKNTISKSDDQNKQFISNLWLLDDKFMTYSFVASDISVGKIRDTIEAETASRYKISNRPDLVIFFNRQSQRKDAIVVEFKGADADSDEKSKALTELPNNLRIVRDGIDGVETIWSYIITTIDTDFARTIKNQESYTELFSDAGSGGSYYRFLKGNNAHVYIVDFKTIVTDSFARNKTFLDILRK